MTRLALALVLAVTVSASQAQTSARPASYRIAGTVVSNIDHHPLQRVPVKLLKPGDYSDIQTTTSDEYGRFEFVHVPAGGFVLQGSAPGYLPTYYQEHGGFNTGIITGAGVDTESLVLELRPASNIDGTVVDEAAEPVQGATVHLFLQSHNSGDSRVVPAQVATTNDLGHFELSRLQPGTYFLAVTARPWYAMYPQEQQQQRPSNLGFTDAIDPSLDVAYPVTYYPGTTDPAGSAPIRLSGGDSINLHFQLTPQPAVSLTIPRTGGAPQPNTPFPQLRISLFGQLQIPPTQGMVQSPNGVVLTGLAPGDYFLVGPRAPFDEAGGAKPIHLGDRETTVNAPDNSGEAHVHVTLKAANGTALPANVRVSLSHPKATGIAMAQAVNPKGQAELEVAAGDYSFRVESGGRPLFLREVVSGEQTLTGRDVHLDSGESRFFTLTVVPGTHTLKGFVYKDGKPSPGAFILLIPSDEVRDIHSSWRQQSDLDGSWSLNGLAPGSYTVVAIKDGWDLDWARPEVLARYLHSAVTVQIPGNTDRIVSLSQPVVLQPR